MKTNEAVEATSMIRRRHLTAVKGAAAEDLRSPGWTRRMKSRPT